MALTRRLVDMARVSGVEIPHANVTGDTITINSYGEVPTPIKDEMTKLANKTGLMLTFEVRPKKGK